MAWVRLGLTLLAAAVLAWLVVLYGLTASAMSTGNATAALALRPGSPSAASLASEQALARGDTRAARRFAGQTLGRSPRDVRALRVLGIATSLDGQPLRGSEMLLRAGALSWRDDDTQTWLIRQAIEQRNFATATQRIDAMLRRRQSSAEMLGLLHQLAANPQAVPAVVDRLALEPVWRHAFFVEMDYLPTEAVSGHAQLVAAMRAANSPVSREELAAFVRHLLRTSQFGLAHETWLATLNDDGRALARGVYDGDFQQDPAGDSEQPRYPFEWTLDSGAGAFASVGTPPMLIGETALSASTQGGAETRLARQTVMLAPGPHVLSYDVVVGDEFEPQAFEWRVTCGPNKNARALPLERAEGRAVGASRTATARFVVSPECAVQNIELVALEGTASAEAWFDKVRVQ